jgi:UDP-glucose 4-epimerase
VKSDVVGRRKGDIEVCFTEVGTAKRLFGWEVNHDVDGMCFDSEGLNEENFENRWYLSDYGVYRPSSEQLPEFL